ncbi:MAG: glycosyltransferase [bacterium]
MSAYQNKKPLVSICIPAYNAEKTVVSTLQSIINQTYQNLEVIIVDNDSTDDTSAILQKFRDPRIKIYKNSKNIGAEKNWSRCIELANGEYIAIFHANDLYMPDMVEKQVQAFQDNPSIGAVFTIANYINDRGEVIGEHKLPVKLKGKGVYYFSEIFISTLRNGNFLMCPSAMVKSEIYKELAPFNDEQFGTSADLDMWLRILERHPIAILDERLMKYRISSSSGTLLYWNKRTERADFFFVMDHFAKSPALTVKIEKRFWEQYEYYKKLDNVVLVKNLLKRGEINKARNLSNKTLSVNFIINSFGELNGLKQLIVAVILVFGINIGFGKYLGNVLKRV